MCISTLIKYRIFTLNKFIQLILAERVGGVMVAYRAHNPKMRVRILPGPQNKFFLIIFAKIKLNTV